MDLGGSGHGSQIDWEMIYRRPRGGTSSYYNKQLRISGTLLEVEVVIIRNQAKRITDDWLFWIIRVHE
jgi:hypothetical protein